MNEPDLVPILNDLAAGRIDAAEAARLIDAAKAAAQQAPAPADDEADADAHGRRQYSPHARESFRTEPASRAQSGSAQPEPSQPGPVPGDAAAESETDTQGASAPKKPGRGVERIVVRSTGRRVRIVGDAGVATMSAQGPHVLRRNGSILDVSSDGDLGPSIDGFSLLRPPRSLDDLRAITLGIGKELYLRVNPAIPVDVEVTAGSLTTSALPVLGKVRVTAGSASLSDVVEVADALVQAGSATIRGPISHGRSRIRVESGQLSVHLAEDANVTVRAEAQLGHVSWPSEGGTIDELVVGNGAARLDIGVVMGYASVRLDADKATKADTRDEGGVA